MKKSIFAIGLLSLVMILTSFTTTETKTVNSNSVLQAAGSASGGGATIKLDAAGSASGGGATIKLDAAGSASGGGATIKLDAAGSASGGGATIKLD